MLNEEKLKSFTLKNYAKDIVKVNDHIYFFIGYGHSNAIAIIAHHSVILVDTLDSDVRSKILLEDLKKITDKPVKTIIFTHGHPDHRGGAATFKDTVEEIIAFDSMKMPPKYFDRIAPFLNERGEKQFGIALSDEEAISQGIGIREGRAVNEGTYQFLKPTTLYHEDKIERDIDGIHLELVRAPGECDDELFVYLPDDKVMCAGDNYVGCFPNLYAIRGTPYRDVTVWIETLERMLTYDTEYFLPGHGPLLQTQAKIKEVIGNYKDAIESILFQTLDCMRQGMTLDETVQAVHLEDKYQSLEYLEEYYGTVEWSVKSIYNGYVGWFDGNVNQLMPVSLNVYNKTLLELIGEDKLIEKVKNLMQKEEYQLSLQLLELVDDYKDLKKECLLNRAKQMTSANARHYFICAAKEL
ncbi:alkyl sulfatase dimerization domain-containing protein [Longibaculum muris]|uniref:alkyl sulfatase dimerization domain-containing protein n=1 Tax=Longibaculum muris TaxID=1796628 RepID=UPI0022E46BEA|nr:alkyl sulfatase dimerization domain-containing protein [Longibaculum muris]